MNIGLKLAYVDESGTEGEEGWFILTAFVIESDSWGKYDNIMNKLPREIVSEIDFLKDLRHPHPELSPERRHEVSMEVYDLIAEIGYKSLSTIVYQPSATNFCAVEDIYDMAFAFLIERFEYLLTETRSYGVVFVDERDNTSPRQLQDFHYKLKREGTYYANFRRTIGAAAPLRDDESVPMSLADWVASAIRNHFLSDNSIYYEKVRPQVQRHPRKGTIFGSGIKLIPDDDTVVQELEHHPDDAVG